MFRVGQEVQGVLRQLLRGVDPACSGSSGGPKGRGVVFLERATEPLEPATEDRRRSLFPENRKDARPRAGTPCRPAQEAEGLVSEASVELLRKSLQPPVRSAWWVACVLVLLRPGCGVAVFGRGAPPVRRGGREGVDTIHLRLKNFRGRFQLQVQHRAVKHQATVAENPPLRPS